MVSHHRRMNESLFAIESHGEHIRGVLWTPDGASRCPLVLAGHGFGQHKRALYPATLAADLTARGFAIAAIDAPAHGDRRTSDSLDGIAAAWGEHWRAHGASRIAEEHTAVIDTLAAHPRVDANRIGYFGLSLATQYGIGVLASEDRIRAAVLGLFSLADPGRLMRRYAPRVGCPVFFILQLNDELHPADRAGALFDLLASPEKTLHASAGGHVDVPRHIFEQAYDFLESCLRLTSDIRPPVP
jgi:dienelactone hydrolase